LKIQNKNDYPQQRIVVKLVDGTFVQNLTPLMIKLHETCVQAW
jgi:hypothetical protein